MWFRPEHDRASAHFTQDEKQFLDSLPRSMDRTNRAGFVASAIARSHNCRRPPVGPSEGHSLVEKCQHVGRTLSFDSSGWENNTTHDCKFSAYQEFLTSQGPVVHSE
jgi:hypothetical protein